MAKKKIRKFLKKALPLAALGLGAMGLARRRATDAPGNAMAKAKRLMTSDAAYSDQLMPDHLVHDMGSRDKWAMPDDPHQYRWPMSYKKGGRVTGAAKRGFGRALMKEKK
jgi:hypothetical protein